MEARQTRLRLLLLLFAFAVIIFHVTSESAEAVSCGTTNCGLVFKSTCGPCQRCVNRVVFESCEDDAACEPACAGANPQQCDFDNIDPRLSQCDNTEVCWQSRRQCISGSPHYECADGYTPCSYAYCCKGSYLPDKMCYDNKVWSVTYGPSPANSCNFYASTHYCYATKTLEKDCNTGNSYGSCPGTCLPETTTSGIIGPDSTTAGTVYTASCSYSACPTPTPTPTITPGACTDSDATPAYPDGRNYCALGTCKDTGACIGAGCTDPVVCNSANSVKEWYCSGTSCASEIHGCLPGSCSYGLCETPTPTATPSLNSVTSEKT